MKYIYTFIIIFFSTLSGEAQHQNQILIMDSEAPLVLINDSVICNFRLLSSVSKEDILELDVKKEQEIGTKKLFLLQDKNSGLLIARVNLGFKIKTKTQQELNEFFGLEPSTDIYVNGYLLENKTFSIAAESIKKVEIIPADDLFLKQDVLNISI